MLKLPIIIGLFIALSSSPSGAQAPTGEPLRCQEVFSRESGPKAANYAREVLNSKGLRLFFKPASTESDQLWYGFLSKSSFDPQGQGLRARLAAIASYVPRKIGDALSRERGYSFTPFAGLYNLTVRMPVEYISARFCNRKFEPAFFFKFPLIVAVSMTTYNAADRVYTEQLHAHTEASIQRDTPAYNNLIQNDYRYHTIKKALDAKKLTPQQAVHEAYLVTLAYSQYFELRDREDHIPSVKEDMKLLNHYLFIHLKDVVTNGVRKVDPPQGFLVPDSSVGPLKETQVLELFNNAHQRYLKYQIIAEMVSNTPLWESIKQNKTFAPLVESILQDPFTQQLIQLRDEGRITSGQMQSMLQEDAYWQNRFQDWKIIGVIRLKKSAGVFSTEPLTLADIREEILMDVAAPASSRSNR